MYNENVANFKRVIIPTNVTALNSYLTDLRNNCLPPPPRCLHTELTLPCRMIHALFSSTCRGLNAYLHVSHQSLYQLSPRQRIKHFEMYSPANRKRKTGMKQNTSYFDSVSALKTRTHTPAERSKYYKVPIHRLLSRIILKNPKSSH